MPRITLVPNPLDPHGVAALTCPYCGSPDIQPMPNRELRTKVLITPYHCTGCQRTFESGPFQLAQKANKADPKPKRHGN